MHSLLVTYFICVTRSYVDVSLKKHGKGGAIHHSFISEYITTSNLMVYKSAIVILRNFKVPFGLKLPSTKYFFLNK